MVGRFDAIQKKAAYFGCIAAPDGNSEAHAPAEQPFSFWPASSAPPRWSRAMTGVAGWHKRTAGWTTHGGRGHRQSRCRSESEDRGRQTCVHLHRGTGLVGCARWMPPGQARANSLKTGGDGLAGPGKIGNSRRPPPGAPNILPLLTRLSIARSTSTCRYSRQLYHPLVVGVDHRYPSLQ